MALYYVLFFFFSFASLCYKSINKLQFLKWFTAIALILICSLRGPETSRDYLEYIRYYIELSNGGNIVVENSFKALVYILKDPKLIFIFYATVGILVKYYVLNKLSVSFYHSLLVYISYWFLLHEMTQMRTGVAVSFMFLAIYFKFHGNLFYFLVSSFLSYYFHNSFFIVFFFWLIDTKPIRISLYISVLVISILAFILNIDIMTTLINNIGIGYLREKYMIYIELLNKGEVVETSLKSPFYLLKFLVFIFFYIKNKKFCNPHVNFYLKLYVIGLIVYPLLHVFMPVAIRLSQLFTCVDILLIPMIFIFYKSNFIRYIFVFVYSAIYLFKALIREDIIRNYELYW